MTGPPVEPLTAEEEAVYRDGLDSAPTVHGLDPFATSLVSITIAEWADRCRRLFATLDAARASAPVSVAPLAEAIKSIGWLHEFITGGPTLYAGLAADVLAALPDVPTARDGIDPERLHAAYDRSLEDWSPGEAGLFEATAAEYDRLTTETRTAPVGQS